MKKTVLLVALIAGFALTACGDKDEPMATFESPEAADKAVAAAATEAAAAATEAAVAATEAAAAKAADAAAAMKESPAMEDATKQQALTLWRPISRGAELKITAYGRLFFDGYLQPIQLVSCLSGLTRNRRAISLWHSF